MAPATLKFTNTSTPTEPIPPTNKINYEWDFGDASALSNLKKPSGHTYTDRGNYIIKLKVWDDTKTDEKTKEIVVKKLVINPG